jgi:phage terminase large subunit-like protein
MGNIFGDLAASLRDATETDWRRKARPEQLPPPGDWWSIWLLLAGRGFGKTRVLSESALEAVLSGYKRIAIVAATAGDCRDVVIEGESGILACAPKWNRPEYEPTKRRLTWPNGAIATAYSADEAERLRGPQHDFAICDELAAWRYPESWDMLMMGLRLGKNPRAVVATTPKPTRLVRDLVAREGKDVVITRGRTKDNEANLAPQFLKTIVARFQGTRLGRQELDGELLTDTPNALWSHENLDATRVDTAPTLQRVVIGLDPSGSGGENADECGLIVAGLGVDSELYVIADLSGRFSPTEWARRAIGAFHYYKADRIVAETNYGGAMVLSTISAIDPGVPVKAITSSRGKVLRAEPISAIWEQGRGHLVGSNFVELQDEMTSFTTDWDRSRGSPNRVDALVFSAAELISGAAPGGFFNESALLINGEPDVIPPCVQNLFGVLATSDRPGAAVAFMIFGTSPNDVTPRLHAIDWRICELDEAMSLEWLSSAYARVQELAREWKALNNGSPEIFVEKDDNFGEAAYAMCWMHMEQTGRAINLCQIERRRKQPIPSLDQRVESARATINCGAVKLARPAFEREEPFRASTGNHLLTQLRKFDPVARDQPVELVVGLCMGVGLWKGDGA